MSGKESKGAVKASRSQPTLVYVGPWGPQGQRGQRVTNTGGGQQRGGTGWEPQGRGHRLGPGPVQRGECCAPLGVPSGQFYRLSLTLPHGRAWEQPQRGPESWPSAGRAPG